MSRLRVVYLDHVARLSGGELALLRSLEPLLDRIDPLVVLAEDGPLVGALTDIGVEVRVVPLSPALRDLRKDRSLVGLRVRPLIDLARYVWMLRALIRIERAALVHTNSLKSALYGGVAARLAGVPVVWHIRDRISSDYLPSAAVALVRALSRVLPSFVIANSRMTLATVRPRRGRVVPNSVAPNSGHTVGTARSGPVTLGLIGRLAPWKGQELFLRAFAAAFPRGDERAVLIGAALFGEDEYAAWLPPLAESLGISDRTVFRGFQADVEAELSTIDILVHCSLTPEPFGQVILEGMAAGLAVLAAAEGGPSEIITDGVDGILVAPRDPVALAAAMRTLAADETLRSRLGSAALATAADYTPASTAEGWLDVYRDVLPTGMI